MNARYAAAIDLSGRSAGFALMKDQELLCAASRPMRGRDSAELADFVAQQLAANGVELAEVSDWTVGSGPGSFTGLRLAAALAAGWTFGKEGVRTRCVPTAVALAARLETANGDRIGCLFDGRNRELIYFEVENFGGELVPTGESRVLNKEQAAEFFRDLIRLRNGAVRDADRLHAEGGEMEGGRMGRAAGPDEGDAGSGEGAAEILQQRMFEAVAVGAGAVDAAVFDDQGVHAAGGLRGRVDGVEVRDHRRLVRHGQVHAL